MKTPNILKSRIPICLAIALVWLLPAVRVSGSFAQRLVFKPAGTPPGTNEFAFWGTETSPYDLIPKVSTAKAGANQENGGVAAFASAWVGGASSYAAQYVGFVVPEPCYVTATIKMTYTGSPDTFGFASWAGTAWRWRVDRRGQTGFWEDQDIDAAFTVETVGGKIIDIALLFSEVFTFPRQIEVIITLIDETWSMYQLKEDLSGLLAKGQAAHIEKTIEFYVPAGTHLLVVGLKANASAFLTGFGSAFLRGQVEEIDLTINSQWGALPDMVVSGLRVENEAALQSYKPVTIRVERSNVGNDVAPLETYLLWAEPTNGSPSITLKPACQPGQGGCLHVVQPYSQTTETVHYAGFANKGDYDLWCWENPYGLFAELNDQNNMCVKRIHVHGTRPNTPPEPNYGYTLALQRNHTFTFYTSGADADGDRLFYRFEIQPSGSTNWLALTNTAGPFTNGWGTTSNLTITPVADDPDLWPPASAGLDTNTYVVLSGSQYPIHAMVADPDGISDPSAARVFTLRLNTLPATPTLAGDDTGDTLRGISITVSSSDAEGDPIYFRFDWGGQSTPTWTEWIPCAPGSTSLTMSHLYANAKYYKINVEATDLYSIRNTSPVKHSATTSRLVQVSTYTPAPDSLVVMTVDQAQATRLPSAGFLIAGPTNFATATDGNGFWQSPGLPGTYTITFGAVPGFVTPVEQTQVLVTNGAIQFIGNYTHQVGTIQVNCNVPGQGTITGAGSARGNNHAFSGLTWTTTNAWAGQHVIAYRDVDATTYGLPVPPRETNTLAVGGTNTFWGRYLKRPIAQVSVNFTNSYQPSNTFVLVNEDEVELDASSSSLPEQPTGNGLFPPLVLTKERYRFAFDDNRPYEEVTTNAPDGLFDGKTAHVFHRTGWRQVAVTVFDSAGCSSLPTNVQVRVKERPVASVEIDPSPAILGETVTFTGSGSDADNDKIVNYEWSLAGSTLSTNQTFTTNSLAAGDHPISLRVRADDNVWSQPIEVSLNIMPPKEWACFKMEARRRAGQSTYADRVSGQLPYGMAGGHWPHGADSPFEGSPVAANVDGDWVNGLEVAFVARSGKLFLTDRTGANLWLMPREIGRSSSTPTIADLDGDGSSEIVVGSTNGVYAISVTSTNKYLYTSNSFIFSMPVIADIDPRAPGLEVAVSADDGSVHLIHADGTAGTNNWPFTCAGAPFPSPPDDPNNVYFTSGPAVADLDRTSPGLEVVVGGANGHLYLLDSTGLMLSSFPIGTNLPIRTTPAIAEVCPTNPGPEIVFGADDGVLYCLGYCFTNQLLYKLWDFYDSAPIRSSPAVAVLGGYGINDVAQIAFGCDSGDVHVLLGTNGAHLGTFSCPGTNVVVRSTPAIADIDTVHNAMPEVIFGANNGYLYAVCFAPHPTLVWSNNLCAPNPIFSSPAVADLDHSPDLEILVGTSSTSSNKLCVLRAIADPNLVPVADFIGVPGTGGRPLAVNFTDISSNSPTSWLWEFGDGSTSTSQDPSHTYDLPGTNSVALLARNAHGSGTITKTNYIIINPVPLADFIAAPPFGGAPLTVQFTDQSLYGPTSWLWNFGDGQTSSQQHPSHVYSAPGDYTVTLTTWNSYGTNTVVKTNYLTALAVCPEAAFTQDVASGWEPLTVQFTDLSSNAPTSWNWNFGDGGASSNQHPVHAYQTAGRYLVSLTVSNAAGTDTAVSSSYVNVQPVVLSELPPLLDLHFDEGSGTIAHDSSTNHNDGTISGATWTNGYAGSALHFNGSSGNQIVVPHSASLDITNTFWVEAWIKAQGTANYLGIVDKFSGGVTSGGFTLYVNGGQLRLSIYSGAKGNCDLWAGLTDLRDNQWHHVAAGWDGSCARGYVDGGKLAEVSWTNAPASTTQPLCVGKRYTGYGTAMPFLGAIDEVRITRANPGADTLSAALSGTNVVVSWTGFGTLEAATNVLGPYLTVTNATCPYHIPPTVPQMFYRLRGP